MVDGTGRRGHWSTRATNTKQPPKTTIVCTEIAGEIPFGFSFLYKHEKQYGEEPNSALLGVLPVQTDVQVSTSTLPPPTEAFRGITQP